MIFLTSTSDVLQVITASASTVSVHASYVDNTNRSVTAGRTNTRISTATTTTVLSSPAAGTYRSVELLVVTNTSSSVKNNITIQYYDGSTTVIVWYGILSFSESIHFTPKGFQKFNIAGIPISSYGTIVDTRIYNWSSYPDSVYTWIKPTNFTPNFVMVKLWGGGGGGGGGGSLSTATAIHGGSGGGGGAHASFLFLANELPPYVTVTVGGGGTIGAGGVNGNPGTAGTAGRATTFGSYLYAGGGGGGTGGLNTPTATAGGAGGGVFTTPLSSQNAAIIGGQPIYTQTIITSGSISGSGASGAIIATTNALAGGLCAEYGGGAGAGQPATASVGSFGGSSLWGGGGGGHGGCHTATPATVVAGDGGASGTYTSGGGGAAGTSGVSPTAGGDGITSAIGQSGGGGGGGSSVTTGVTAGSGGYGGGRGGGGGGGGAAANPGTGGNGGYPGNGYAVVVSW